MDTSRNWHEDDRFWEVAEAVMFDGNRRLEALGDVDRLIEILRPTEGASFLDLCCGPGRHSTELARRGYRVTGVDRTRRFLDQIDPVLVETVHEDARKFIRPNSFDFALNLYTSFGYFEDPAEDLIVARNLCQSLKPGGSLVIQTLGKELVARNYAERGWVHYGDVILLDERRLHWGFGAMENRWTLIHPDGRRDEIGFVVRLYAASELVALLRQAGFSGVRLLGGLGGMPYDHNAQRLVAVATR